MQRKHDQKPCSVAPSIINPVINRMKRKKKEKRKNIYINIKNKNYMLQKAQSFHSKYFKPQAYKSKAF